MSYKKKQNVNYYKNGSTLRGIGAGLYGVGEGILDTATMGMTDNLTDKGFTALQNAAGISESERRAQQGIKGATNLAGAAGTAIVNPALTKHAIGEGAEGIQDMGMASGNENFAKAGNAVGSLGNMARGIPGMPQGAGAMGQGMAFNYGGNMYLNRNSGGPPEKNTVNYKILQKALDQTMKGNVTPEDIPKEKITSFEQLYPNMQKAVKQRYDTLMKEQSNLSQRENNVKELGGDMSLLGGPGDDEDEEDDDDETVTIEVENKSTRQGKAKENYKRQSSKDGIYGEVAQDQIDKFIKRNSGSNKYVGLISDNFDPRNPEHVRNFQIKYNESIDNPEKKIDVDGKLGNQTVTARIPKMPDKFELPIKQTEIPTEIGTIPNTTSEQYRAQRNTIYGGSGGHNNVKMSGEEANHWNKNLYQLKNLEHVESRRKLKSKEKQEKNRILKELNAYNAYGNFKGANDQTGLSQERVMNFSPVMTSNKDDFLFNYNNKNRLKFDVDNPLPDSGKKVTEEELKKAEKIFEKFGGLDKNEDKLTTKESIKKREAENTILNYTKQKNSQNNTKKFGGNLFNNGGFGSNQMNENPVTEFGSGGTHEENSLGGIPQGIGQNGKPNLVEEGELKIKDPRNSEDFYIISADKSMKITKDLAEKFDLPKKYTGKTVKQAAEKILRKDSKREGDTIEENSKNLDLKPLIEIHDVLTERKEQEQQEEFQKEIENLEKEYPEYMKALKGSSTPQQPKQMPPEQQQMPQGPQQGQPQMPQQGMGAEQMPQGMGMEQGMPSIEGMGMPGMRHGGKANSYANGGPGSGFDASMNYESQGLGNPYQNDWKDQYGLSPSGQTKNDSSFDPLKDTSLNNSKSDYEVNQSALNAGAQLLPAVYNIGMGLGEDEPITSGRVDRQELEEMELGQAEIDARQSAAASRRNVRNSGVGQAGYLSNIANVQRNQDSTMAKMHSNLRNQNAQIDNQQAQIDMNVDRQNIGLDLKEQQMQRLAERERQAMMSAGISQIGQYAQAQEKDKLGAAYSNMYSDDFSFNYNTPLDQLKK